METTQIAKKIGSDEGYIAVGLALAADVCVLLYNFGASDFEIRYLYSFALFAAFLIAFGQLFSRRAGHSIIVGKSGFWWIGIACAFGTLIIGTMCAGICSFAIDVALGFENADQFASYAFAVPLLFAIYSSPILIVHGIVFGYRIYRKGKKLASVSEPRLEIS